MTEITVIECEHCRTTIATVTGDYVFVEGRHHGHHHVSRIALPRLRGVGDITIKAGE